MANPFVHVELTTHDIPVADLGKFTIFKDPTGAVIAMWQQLRKM